MRILDRYVLLAFLRNYLVSLFVLVGFYILLDMIFNFDEFTKYAGHVTVGQIISGIAGYYFFQSFFVYAQLAGVVPVLAAAFTFMRMSRFNELTALLSAGVPLARVALPVLVAAVGLNLIIQPVNQELIIPSLAEHITREHDEVFDRSQGVFAVRSMPDGQGGIFDAARYHPADLHSPAWVESLTVVERDAENVSRLVVADRGEWDVAGRGWRLTGGRAVTNLALPTSSIERSLLGVASALSASPAQPLEVLETTVTPAEIELFRSANVGVVAGGSYFDLLSTRQINELLQRPQQYAPSNLLRAKHSRLSSHVMNIVLILLAIPAVLTREPGHLRRAAGRTLLLVGSAMGAVFLCQLLARDPPSPETAARWPVWMAWAPVLVFGPLSIALLDRLET
jgi:lipopolysaccharide export LptBFGC system permease protein LptF